MPMPVESKIQRNLLFLSGVVLAVILLVAAWSVLRRSAGRVAGDFLYPYLALSRTTADAISDQTLLLASRRELAGELELLRRENRRLAAQAATAAELLVENGALRRLTKLAPPDGWEYVNAEIILRDPRMWNEHVTIDRGSRDGVRLGAAAMTATPDGRMILVGVVSHVSHRTAEIITLFHSDLRLSASLPVSGAVGIVNAGDGTVSPELAEVGFLPVNRNYVPDEVLLTTGFERQIPPGVKIGNLVDVERADSLFSSALYLKGTLRPAVQLSSIRFLVLANRLGEEIGK